MTAMYVLAITRDAPPGFQFEGHRVEFMPVGGVVAAIERSASRQPLSEAALRIQHEIVLQIAARVDEILPVRFGAWVDERELEQVLTLRQAAIQEALDLVRGHVQMTIRVRAHGTAEQVDVRPSGAPTTGTAYLEARRAATVQPAPPAAIAATDAVRHLVIAERHDSSPRQPVRSIYHLVERSRVHEYLAALSAVDLAQITVSGPWPPFAFAPDVWP